MITLLEQITCVKREIALRSRVYPKQVAAGKMKEADATHELATMKEVLKTLEYHKLILETMFGSSQTEIPRSLKDLIQRIAPIEREN